VSARRTHAHPSAPPHEEEQEEEQQQEESAPQRQAARVVGGPLVDGGEVERQAAEGVGVAGGLGVRGDEILDDLPPVEAVVAAGGVQRELQHLVALLHQRGAALEEQNGVCQAPVLAHRVDLRLILHCPPVHAASRGAERGHACPLSWASPPCDRDFYRYFFYLHFF
jgi:hypothetical protein